MTVVPGTTYTISMWVDPSQITAGDGYFALWNTGISTQYVRVSLTGGSAGRYASAPWTCPNGVTQVVWLCGCDNTTVITSGQKLKFSQPQLEMNTVATPYQSSSAITPNVGGSYFSTFSISGGWLLSYTIGSLAGTESVDIYGSDGSHIVGDQNVARAANQTLTLVLPTSSLKPGVMYVVRLWFKDSNGNIGVYRDFITAMA